MSNDEKSFNLDDTAKELYAQLAGIDTSTRVQADGGQEEPDLIELLGEEEKFLDHYRILLNEAVVLLADLLNKGKLSDFADEHDRLINSFLAAVKKFAQFPKFDGRIFIRFQGRLLPTEKDGSQAYDYELAAGNLLVDLQVARIVGKRRGAATAGLYNQLLKACKICASLELNNLHLDIGSGTPEELAKIAEALKLLCRYFRELAGAAKSDFLILDEYELPNPNLTLLAAINKVRPEAIRNLLEKVKPLLFGENPPKEIAGFVTIYDALFAFKNVREQLKKPPVELNNIQRLLPIRGGKKPSAQQAQVSRMVIASYGKTPQAAAQVLSSVNSEGYRNIYCGTLGSRLSLASDFLNLTASSPKKETLTETVLGNIGQGLEMVADEIFDDLKITGGGEVNATDSGGQKVCWQLHQELTRLLDFFKRRTIIKKKMREMPQRQVEFDAKDYAVIARNFKITEEEAAHLIGLLKNCFDEGGRFRRSAFEKNIPEFVQYESKVFEFLWHYLKELIARDDRVSFLNALQILFTRIHKPGEALRVLLADIFLNSHHVTFSDRNGVILANILIRKYNQELGSHIELTPEEVLLVREGLSSTMVTEAARFIAEEEEHIYQKFRVIHEELQKSLSAADPQEHRFPIRYLTTLERELIIFLSLIGGGRAHRIIRGVAKEYGNPGAAIYTNLRQAEHLRSFLQLLQVALRSLRRFSDASDLPLFHRIHEQGPAFLSLRTEEGHAELVKRVISWAK